MSAYTSLGGRSRRRGGGGGRYYGGPTQREIAAAERAQRQLDKLNEMQTIEKAAQALTLVHHQMFPSAERPSAPEVTPVDLDSIKHRLAQKAAIPELESELGGGEEAPIAPDPEGVDRSAMRKQFRLTALSDVPLRRVGERRTAKKRADELAEEAAKSEEAKRAATQKGQQEGLDRGWAELLKRRKDVAVGAEQEAEQTRRQRETERAEKQTALDADWELLQANDPAIVMATLEAAFADNEAPAAPIDSDGAAVTATMKFEGPEIVPERRAGYTPTGKPSLRRRTKAEINDLYLQALSSNVLATVKETLAVAPGIDTVSVLVVREETKGKYEGRLAAIYAGQFSRDIYPPLVAWRDVDLIGAAEDAPGSLLNLRGQSREVSPLDLRAEPDLQSVLEQIAGDLGEEPVVPAQTKRKSTRPKSMPVTEILERVPSTSDSNDRWEALWGLLDRRLDLASVEPLGQILTSDSDSSVRELAAHLLGQIRDASSGNQLIRGVEDDHPNVRCAAITSIGNVAASDHLPILIAALDDPDPHVRAAAIPGLRESGHEYAFEAIAERIQDPDPDVRFEAACGLYGRDDDVSKAALALAREDPDPHVRVMAT